jgi:phosphohistidine phosphatase
MKILGLFRHAKSDWHDPRARDFDRPLNARGRKGAAVMGRHIVDHGAAWERIIASPAVRCAETIEIACRGCGPPGRGQLGPAHLPRQQATLIDLLRETVGDPKSILMVGHNPGLEDLIFDLVPDDGTCPLARCSGGEVPHSGLCRAGTAISSAGLILPMAAGNWST